jgi:hypothetical protein
MLTPDFKEFVELLIKNEVEYMIVGGYAVGIHGHPRFTGDLDIWLKPSEPNALKILKCVDEFGFGSFNLQVSDFVKIGNVIQFGNPPLRIDLLTEIDGVKFDECYLNRMLVDLEGLVVSFIGYRDLLKNKKETGRLKDLDDLENLK